MRRILPALAIAAGCSTAPPLTEARMRQMIDEALAASAACPQPTLTPGPGWYTTTPVYSAGVPLDGGITITTPVYSAALPCSESGTCVVEGGIIESVPAQEKSR